MSDTQFDDEILDSNAISPTDEEGNPVPVTIPIALAPGVTVVYTTRLGGVSHGDFGDCNLGGKGGDDLQAILANRVSLAKSVGCGLAGQSGAFRACGGRGCIMASEHPVRLRCVRHAR